MTIPVQSGQANRRINLLRKFHNTLRPRVKPHVPNHMGPFGQNDPFEKGSKIKPKFKPLPRNDEILKLQKQIKNLLMKRDKNQFKLFY